MNPTDAALAHNHLKGAPRGETVNDITPIFD